MKDANPSAREPAQGHRSEAALPRPGLVGRLIRLTLGLLTLLLLWELLTGWRHELWAGRLPFDFGFLIVVCLALRLTSYVFNLAFGLAWGQRTLLGVLAGAVAAVGAGYVLEGALPNTLLGTYLWVWFVGFCGLLGPALVLAAALGTSGCEMRSYAHLAVFLRGGDVGEVACPGGIDRFDDLGRRTRHGRVG